MILEDLPSILLGNNLTKLEDQMSYMEQVTCDVEHTFSPGLYIRKMSVKAGTLVVGHIHKTTHFNIMLKGKILLLDAEENVKELSAPQMFVSPPGKKAAVVLEDLEWVNIFPTTETNVEILEQTFLDMVPFILKGADVLPLLTEERTLIDLHQEDFIDACAILGFTVEEVSQISQITSDLIDLPLGTYKIEVGESKIHGKGVFASATINSGEILGLSRIGNNRTPLGRYINHGVIPNAEMFILPDGDIGVRALLEIKGKCGGQQGEEILVDYVDSYNISRNKVCLE